MKLVVVESPLAGDFKQNIRYARYCLVDCFRRGDAAFASHLLYPQVFNDASPEQRAMGMDAGLAWAAQAELAAVYVDLGITDGMRRGMEQHRSLGIPIEMRTLPVHLMMQFMGTMPEKDVQPTEGSTEPMKGMGETMIAGLLGQAPGIKVLDAQPPVEERIVAAILDIPAAIREVAAAMKPRSEFDFAEEVNRLAKALEQYIMEEWHSVKS